MNTTAYVVTSISQPNRVMQAILVGASQQGSPFYVIGDRRSPPDFKLSGSCFLSIEDQKNLSFAFSGICPEGHYARKNIGYLLAAADGAEIIVETDDDNFPRAEFFSPRSRFTDCRTVNDGGIVNVYRYFSDAPIWPRGLPLTSIHHNPPPLSETFVSIDAPIQQGLADENPDVDAIYRLAMPLPQRFRDGRVALGRNSWCPFNSQNTAWWRDSFPLLYLPATCSFRMTDIWRSFVAQRIAWENDWYILFHGPTVWQERNEHDLMKDFVDEIPGYLGNADLINRLRDLHLDSGKDTIQGNLRKCYQSLADASYVSEQELELLEAWLIDVESIMDRKVENG